MSWPDRSTVLRAKALSRYEPPPRSGVRLARPERLRSLVGLDGEVLTPRQVVLWDAPLEDSVLNPLNETELTGSILGDDLDLAHTARPAAPNFLNNLYEGNSMRTPEAERELWKG